jgi:phosphate transport system permease protein
MAVALVAGNRERGYMRNPFQTVRLLTTNIVMEQGYATELHAQLLWSTAVILLLFIILINLALKQINKHRSRL